MGFSRIGLRNGASRGWTGAALLLGLAGGCDDAPLRKPGPPAPTTTVDRPDPPVSLDVPRAEVAAPLLAIEPDTVDAGQHFDSAAPLMLRVRVPAGATVPGRGLPPATFVAGGALPPDADQSVVQVELPVNAYGMVDERDQIQGGVATFDTPRYCRVGDDCPWPPDTDGLWRGVRVRRDTEPPTITEVQLAPVGWGPESVRANHRIVGVWMAEDAVPLDAFDELQLSYVGNVPRRATDVIGEPLRPRLRLRTGDADWILADTDEIAPLHILPGPPRFLRVAAPLDTEAGVPFDVALVLLDDFGNPAPHTGAAQLVIDGAAAGAADLDDAFRGAVSVATDAGDHRLDAEVSGLALTVQPQWTRTWPAGGRPHERLLGDVHIHSGDGLVNEPFHPEWGGGDHAGQFTRTGFALAYLREVSSFDFGAMSEHSYRPAGWSLPPGMSAAFGPGGPCEVTSPERPFAWWTLSQEASGRFGDEHPEFVTFPAYEWSSPHLLPGDESKLHRVVMFRNHAADGDLPLLAGGQGDLPPQCVVRFYLDAGMSPDEVLIIPHMSRAHSLNLDFDLTYDGGPEAEAIASPVEVEAYQTVGEIFSARNLGPRYGYGAPVLTKFEGGIDPGELAPFHFRYAWSVLGVHIGVIAASDNHVQMPGVDDLGRADGSPNYHAHEPGGPAIVLADPAQPRRDGIFEALGARRAYATTGPRVWLDVRVGDGVDSWAMGRRIVPTVCALDLDVELLAGTDIRRLEVFTARGGGDGTWTVVAAETPQAEVVQTTVALLSQATPYDPAGSEWVYTVRAFLGEAGDPDARDAVWSSPIWIDWAAHCGS